MTRSVKLAVLGAGLIGKRHIEHVRAAARGRAHGHRRSLTDGEGPGRGTGGQVGSKLLRPDRDR